MTIYQPMDDVHGVLIDYLKRAGAKDVTEVETDLGNLRAELDPVPLSCLTVTVPTCT